ncbi:ERF family protein [Sphaerochaeta sp.]|uniref:ERF family protein n=1 Tax=Sphaerochaeta sp. TaxID=1972642 RepID=UPI002FC7E09F
MADIYTSIACIMADIDAVGKTQKNQQQGFKFRGIDDIYNAVHPILAKHGVFTVPTVLSERSEERTTTRGGNLIYRILTMKYTFFASDGSSVDSVVIGEGMDSGDKAANKAMSVAHKYALLQALCIPTEEMADPDKESFEVTQSQNTQSSLSLARSFPRQDTPLNLAGLLSVEEFNIKDAWNSILERCRGVQVAAREVFKQHGADSSKEITYEIYQKVFLSLQSGKAQETKGPEDFIDDEIPFTSSKKRVIA